MFRAPPLFVMLAVLVAGCAGAGGPPRPLASEAPPVVVPWPSLGTVATYAGGPVTVDVRVDTPREVRDVAGANVTLLPVRYVITTNIGKESPSVVRMTEWLDAGGAKALVTAPCDTLGIHLDMTGGGCRDSPRGAFTYAEHGTYAWSGSGAIWGREILPGQPLPVTFGILGAQWEVAYDSRRTAESCVRLSGTDLPDLVDQRFTIFTGAFTDAVFCDGEPFPTAISLARGQTLSRTRFEPGEGEAPLALGVAAAPLALPADARAKPLSRGAPEGMDAEPTPFPLDEAIAAVLADEPTGRQFAADAAWLVVRTSRVTDERSHRLTVPIVMVGQEEVTTTRKLLLEREDGGLYGINATETCENGSCRIAFSDARVWRGPATITSGAKLRTLPLTAVSQDAASLLGTADWSVDVATLMAEASKPDVPAGERQLYRFLATPPEFGPALILRLDGLTGAPLQGFLPIESVERIAGVPRDAM